jgi:uncharacterized membrane protein
MRIDRHCAPGDVTPGILPYHRLQSVDILRGIAIALMILYHFSYDLAYFGFAQFDFYNDPFWLHARTLILSLFLFVVGVSLVLAAGRRLRLRTYLMRLGYIVAGAALISLSSYLMFGPRWIFFGVLHFIAVASILGLAFVRSPRLALLAGTGLIVLDGVFSHVFFDQPALQWLGLMTYKPPTEDYVPLIPWFGVVLLGICAGHRLLRHPVARPLVHGQSGSSPARWLAFAGRHSLVIYLLHQPLLVGSLWAFRQMVPAEM